ncbi:DegV family EDD domain-containing protein [Candidatus Poribacteria bacterium]|nr:DegV family EDD domain-containing protein [Candidatus Poribacteria bacterium]
MRIITDSTCDLPRKLVEEYDIIIVPLTVILGSKSYRDYYDLSPNEFYRMLNETEDFPSTSQPSVDDFLRVYKEIGKDESILSLHISMDMSATPQSAWLASQQLPDIQIDVIDSRTTSVGLGLIVLEAAKAAKNGADDRTIIKLVERLISEVKVYFSVDSLDHLLKGGRIGKAQALAGTMLKIKPLLSIEDGLVTPVEKIRGSRKLLRRMREIVIRDSTENKTVKGAFVWGQNEKPVEGLSRHLSESLNFEEIYRNNLGNVITSHAGPTAFAIGYFCEK